MEDKLREALRAGTPPRAPDSAEHAAVALILSGVNLDLLLIRRADNPRDPWSGQMALPGGRAAKEDLDLEASARRETMEEVGLDLSKAELWGRLPAVKARGGSRSTKLWVTPFVFHQHGPRPDAQANEEVAELFWIDLSALRDPKRLSKVDLNYHGRALSMPAIQIEEHKVWGLTHHIISQLLSLIET